MPTGFTFVFDGADDGALATLGTDDGFPDVFPFPAPEAGETAGDAPDEGALDEGVPREGAADDGAPEGVGMIEGD
jgi:hypothetical protein